MPKREVEKINDNTYRVTDFISLSSGSGEKVQKVVREVKDPIDIWLIGNTGMRNPWRIRGGFKVYVESNLVEKLRKPEDQQAFKKLLYEKGEIGGDAEKDASASITRKYRLMFNKFGFAYPEITKSSGFSQENLGPVDGITPLGNSFYHAETIDAQQECFLRGLIVPMEPLTDSTSFSPLLWVLAVMLELEKRTGSTKLNFVEFATCVQTTNPLFDIEKVADEILKIREARKDADNKKRFDRERYFEKWQRYLKEQDNFTQYADMNIRYILSAGIIKRSGRGIELSNEYHSIAIELIKNVVSSASLIDRLTVLCNGAPLPTDNQKVAYQVLNDVISELDYYKIKYELPDMPLDSVQNVNLVRSAMKKRLDLFKEEQYAARQVNEWQEIYEYMKLLIVNNGREKEISDDMIIRVPQSEAAAYLEWVLWRAFLAIDHIVNKPYESRSFNIDQDYLPVGTASGGKPDMVFEFKDFIIVIEVTLSTNSRQEAMEGEPVRRHVADLVMANTKPVYGVFIANRIDSNTAETFRIGVWYNQSDERISLKIVPFTLEQFSSYFKYMFENEKNTPSQFLELFDKCFASKESKDGPAWKNAIGTIVTESISA